MIHHPLLTAILGFTAIALGALLVWLPTRYTTQTPTDITIDIRPYRPGFVIRPTTGPHLPHHDAAITDAMIVLSAITRARKAGATVTITDPALSRLRLACGGHTLAAMGVTP